VRIFISYRREDCQPQATSIYYGLMQELDAEVFYDVEAMMGGVDFVEEIERQIERADAVVVVIGDDWLSVRDTDGTPRIEKPDDFVQMEIRMALERDRAVIPVTVEGARMPGETELPASIAALGRRHAPKIHDESMPQDIRVLAQHVKQLVENRRAPADEGAGEPEVSMPIPEPRVLVEEDEVGLACVAAAAVLQETDIALKAHGKQAVERDLADALANSLQEAKVEQAWTVPNWDPQPGRFDLLVSAPDGRPRLAVETKLKGGNDIYECLWDLLKLVGLSTLDHVEGVYLVAGTTVRNWEKPVTAAGLFASGEHETTALIAETGSWWEQYLLANSTGRPRWAPPTVEGELVAAVPLQLRGEPWELRALKVAAPSTDWLVMREGRPPKAGEKPIVERPETEADTVIVAGRRAHPEYKQLSAYVCPVKYAIRDVERLGFYFDRTIQPEIPAILDRRESVRFTRQTAVDLRATGDPNDRVISELIDRSLDGATPNAREDGESYKVFVLTPPDDSRTMRTGPIRHNARSAWTMQRRYVDSEALKRANTTEDLISR
jgi:hypothetical protein